MKNICCIGGGHGLGRLLYALQDDEIELSGIVATTDNGGSTGRLRESIDTIAWGDLRHCLSQLTDDTALKKLLFEFRFSTKGELNGHSLGNLMLLALDQMCARPTDCCRVMKQFLDVSPDILPMSDMTTDLTCVDNQGNRYFGELEVEKADFNQLSHIQLSPAVETSEEIIQAISIADLIILAPGSFVTSILPPLLVKSITLAINQTQSQILWIANLNPENSIAANGLNITQKLSLLQSTGLNPINHILWPQSNGLGEEDNISIIRKYDLPQDESGLHQPEPLKRAIMNYL